ncbi:hypothetical protein Tco_0700135 [Tanacetum coccineum]
MDLRLPTETVKNKKIVKPCELYSKGEITSINKCVGKRMFRRLTPGHNPGPKRNMVPKAVINEVRPRFVALLSFVFPFFLFIMSKRNLGSVTQSEFIGFIKEYGIAMCYDHQLLSTKQNALDAPEGYIPLYLSLFSIGNLRLPETLISEARSALITELRHGLGTFSFSYLIKSIDEVLRDHLIRHPFEAQSFPEPILYLDGLASS